MASPQSSIANSSSPAQVPYQFEIVEDLLSMDNDRLRKTPLINVIGVVKDYQPPVQTKGTGIIAHEKAPEYEYN